MSPLLEPIIAQVLVDGLAQRNRQGRKVELFLIVTASLLAAAGLLLLVYALYGGLLLKLAPPVAALAAGVFTLLFALLFAVGAARAGKRRKQTQVAQIPAMAETIEKSLMEIGRELEEPVRQNPGTALLIAGLAGFLSGKHIH